MAWGIFDPVGMGDFAPEGADFQDQDAKLRAAFDQMTEAEKAAFDNRFAKFRYSVALKFRSGDVPLADFEKPTRVRIARTPRALGSIFSIVGDVLIVEQAVRDAIEDLEPGRHQFWNVELVLPKDKREGRRWNVLVIGNTIPAFRRDKTDPSAVATEGGGSVILNRTQKACDAAMLDAAEIDGRHLWKDPGVIDPGLFVSDQLMARLEAADLRLPRHLRFSEI